MPNIAKVLKEEISRISRHEAKVAVTPMRKPVVKLRKDVADLKTRLAALETANKGLLERLARIEAVQPVPPPTESEGKAWISGKGIKSLRKRLGLSQGEFARLVGVSDQAVYLWERKPGMLRLLKDTKKAVFAVRGIGARDARKRLEALSAKQAKATKRGKSRRK